MSKSKKNDCAKYDDGKPRMDLVDAYFPEALELVGRACTHGARLHGEHTWHLIKNPLNRYKAAMRRHQLAIARGEKEDRESGLPHEAHVAWNALAIAELQVALNSKLEF